MKNLLKKIVAFSVVCLVGFPLFAEGIQSKSAPKSLAISLSAGAIGKYQIAGSERTDLIDSARPAAAIGIENSGFTFLPIKLSVGIGFDNWNFIENMRNTNYEAYATADMRLVGIEGFKLFVGGGAVYTSSKKTEDNAFKDCLSGIASAQVSIKVNQTFDLLIFTHIPFSQIKAYMDSKRGADVPENLEFAKGGLMASFKLI